MLGYFLQHLLFHELDSDDPVLGEVVALVDHAVVTLPQRTATIYVEVVRNLLHPLHLALSI